MSDEQFEQPPQRMPVEPKAGGAPDKESRQMAMLAHMLGAFFGFIGPLIIWIVQKDKSSFVDDQGKEALNFSLTMLIFIFAGAIVGTALSCFTFGMSGFLPVVPWIMQLIFGIIGGIKANEGEYYRYPICIRMIS
ncbi:MAG: DUF4870 domain-containing protein [Planctomycetales bacterium]|nr:DUF4870 domain-containing protein [Planctomycetales bacterium]